MSEEIVIPPQPDDIPDPAVPPTVTADGPTVDLQNPNDILAVLTAESLRDFQEKLLAHQAKPLTEEGRIIATAPSGFAVMLITRKDNPGDLIESLTKMQGWLASAGYKPSDIPF